MSNPGVVHLIGYCRILQKTEDILNIMERVYQLIKKHLNKRYS